MNCISPCAPTDETTPLPVLPPLSVRATAFSRLGSTLYWSPADWKIGSRSGLSGIVGPLAQPGLKGGELIGRERLNDCRALFWPSCRSQLRKRLIQRSTRLGCPTVIALRERLSGRGCHPCGPASYRRSADDTCPTTTGRTIASRHPRLGVQPVECPIPHQVDRAQPLGLTRGRRRPGKDLRQGEFVDPRILRRVVDRTLRRGISGQEIGLRGQTGVGRVLNRVFQHRRAHAPTKALRQGSQQTPRRPGCVADAVQHLRTQITGQLLGRERILPRQKRARRKPALAC